MRGKRLTYSNRLAEITDMKVLTTLVGVFGAAAVLTACGADIDIEDGNLTISTEFSLTETMMNSGDNSVFSFADTDFITNAEFDIREGDIVISGDVLCEDGSRADGQMTIAMGTTDDGFIDVEAKDVSASCDIDQELVDRARKDLAESLAEAAREVDDSKASLTFTEVTLADDKLTIAIEVSAQIF